MTMVKIIKIIEKCGSEKVGTPLIDPGGSHHFFNSKIYFKNYEKIGTIDVHAASELSKIFEKGFIWLQIDGGFYIKTYYASKVTTNILSVGPLSHMYNFLFTINSLARNSVRSCIILKRNSKDIVLKTEIYEDGLYRVDIELPKDYRDVFAKHSHKAPPYSLWCQFKHLQTELIEPPLALKDRTSSSNEKN